MAEIFGRDRVLETIRVESGNYINLDLHQWRVDWSRKRLHLLSPLQLKLPKPPKDGIYRTRVLYREEIEEVQFIPYKKREFQKFSLAFSDNIDYSIKFENREEITDLQKEFQKESDDILIIKNGLFTDSSIANLYFQIEGEWFTPKTPLLKGTVRENMIREGRVLEKDIFLDEVKNFQKMAISNAMVGFKILDQFHISQ
jgi:4-amino-4-deoxychorismate lyase